MRNVRTWCFLVLFLAAAPAPAANPKLNLTLENVTAQQAVEALAKASGLQIEIALYPQQPGQPVPDNVRRLDDRFRFDWKGVSLANALRQLRERYQLDMFRNGDTYTLRTTGVVQQAPAAPKPRVGYVEKPAAELWVTQLEVENRRTVNFRPDPPDINNTGRLRVQVQVRLKDRDASELYGIQNVTARDDRGFYLVGEEPRVRFPNRGTFQSYPDEWDEYCSLSGPHPLAKKLEWMEGDLVAYGKIQHFEAGLDLPLPAGENRKRLGQTLVEQVSFNPATGELRMRATVEDAGDGLLALGQHGISAVLVGKSGRKYHPNGMGSNGQGANGVTVYNINATFEKISEEVTRVVLERTEKANPIRLLTFRMKDIPLGSGTFVPQALVAPPPRRPVAPGAPAPLPDRPPFYAEDGGTLSLPVVLPPGGSAAGTLAVGLCARVGEEWSGARWQEVPVDETGKARLENIRPGVYRVIRAYRPKNTARLPQGGTWTGSETEVTVTAGKETTLDPLRWTSAAPTPTPKPTSPPRPKPSPSKRQ